MPDINLTDDLERANKELDGGVQSFGDNAVFLDKQSSNVFDIDTNRSFNVPNIFDEIDTRFAIDVQADKANKSDYLMKTNVSGIYGEVLEPFANFAKGMASFTIKAGTEIYASELAKAGRGDTTMFGVLERLSNLDKNAEEWNEYQKQMIDTSYKVRENSNKFLKDAGLDVQGIAADLGGIGVSITAGLLTRSPTVMGLAFGEISRAGNYLEAIDNGASENEALFASNLSGIGEASLEFVGLNSFLKVFQKSKTVQRKLTPFVADFLEGGTINALQEAAQQGQEELFMQTLGDRERTNIETAKAIAYSGMLGFVGGGTAEASIKAIMKSISKPEEMSEEKFNKFVEDTVTQLYQDKDGIMSDVATLFSKELDPSTDAYTPEEFAREVKRIDGEKRQTITDNLIAKGYTPEQANEALDTAINKVTKINSITQVEIDVSNKLIQAGYSVDEANKQAKVFGANAFKMGNILGIDPYTYYKEHSTFEIVKGEQVKEGDLGQDLTPQQKEFFKDTKVVNENLRSIKQSLIIPVSKEVISKSIATPSKGTAGRGYTEQGDSVNAEIARSNGLATAKEISKAFKKQGIDISADAIESSQSPQEWHHIGKDMKETNFFDVEEFDINSLQKEIILEAKQRQRQLSFSDKVKEQGWDKLSGEDLYKEYQKITGEKYGSYEDTLKMFNGNKNKSRDYLYSFMLQKVAPTSEADITTSEEYFQSSLTPQQKEFFKDTKVVDEKGEPLVVYHGTSAGEFTEFAGGYNWFTNNKSKAEEYSSILQQGQKTANKKTYKVNLNIKKPKVVKTWIVSSDIDKIKATGKYDGVIVKDVMGSGDDFYISFSSNQIKEVSNVAPTSDPNIYKQSKRGFIRENETGIGYIIGLLDSDLSTFLHEGFGHLFTLELKKAGVKSPVAKKKWDTLADYYGYDENGTKQEKEDALERMSRAFESYFMEGKSPNKRLASAFETFKQWLVEIYKSFSSLRTYINPEVKAVFDTLVGGKSIDEVFTDEGTKLYSELNAIKERKFEKLFSGQISANDIVENKGLISGAIGRIKQLSDGISNLATKDKNPIVAIADEFGVVRLNDIETAIKISHMRVPAEPKKLVNVLRSKRVGGINAQWARRLGIIDKDFDKTVFVKEGGISNENDLVDALIANDFMNKTAAETYGETSAQWDEALNLLENMNEVSTDINKSQAREIALDARNSADEYIGKIFPNKSEAEILEMIDDYKSKNNLYDKISKGAAKDIKSLMNEIDSNIKSLSRAIKKDNMQEAKDIKEIIIDLISDLPKAQRGDFIYKIKNINTAKQLTKELPEIVDKIREILESNFTKRIDKKIKSILRNSIPKKINGRLKSRFDNSEIQDVMNNANKIMDTDPKILEKELSEFNFDKVVTAEEAFDNMLKDVALGTASPETYIDVYNSLRDIYENGKIAGEAARILRTENNKRLIAGTEEVIKKSKGKVILSKLNNMLKSFVGWDDALDFLSGGDKTSKLGESFISKEFDVFKEELKERKTANDWLFTLEEKIKEALGVKDSREVSKYIDELGKVYDLGEFQFLKKDATGEYITKNVTMTKDQMIDFYMKMKDKVAYKSIIDEQGNAFSEDLIKTIESHLTAKDIKVAEAIFDFYLNTRDEVFEYNRVQTGISLKPRENYSPRYRDMGKEITATVASIKQSLAGSGRFKEATEAVAPIKFAGAFNTVNKYIMEVSNYMAWQNKLRDLNVVFSNKEVFDYIKDIFGNGMNKLISEKIQGFADRGKVYSNLSDDFINRLRANYTTAVLSINPSLWFKQLTAFAAYADEIPTVDFISGVVDFLANPKKAINALSDSTFVKNRAKDFTLEVKEINESTPVRNFLANKNFRNLMMLPTSLGDKSSIFLGGYPVYRYWIKQGLNHEQAIEKFERASNSTQQSSYLSQLSSWQGNNLGKLFAMFTSAPNQYFRKEYSAIRGLITGRMPYDQVIKRIAIYHFILPMFFQLIANLGRWDDKDEARAAMLGSFNGLFIIGDALEFLISKAQGDFAFSNNIPFIKEFESGAKALVDMAKSLDDIGSEDFFDAIKDLTASAGNIAGLPVEKLYNIWEGAMDIMDGEYIYGTEKLLGWTPWVVKDQEGGLPKIIAEQID